MTIRYDDVLGPLREAYDAGAAWRDGTVKEPWKLAERLVFGDRLAPGARLLEILLHVPNRDLPSVLAAVRLVLRPGGLFFVGVYGGEEGSEGALDDDGHAPPRFFSWRTDEQLLGFAAEAGFDLVDFHPVDSGRGYRFQSLTLRRPDADSDCYRGRLSESR
jgi:hypothetical protein